MWEAFPGATQAPLPQAYTGRLPLPRARGFDVWQEALIALL